MNPGKGEKTPPSCLTPPHPYHGLCYPETALQLLQLIPQERQTYTQEHRLRIRIGARSQWRLGLSSCHSTVPPQTSYTSWIPFNLKGERAGESIKTPIKQVSQLNYHQLKCKLQGDIMAGAIQRPDRKKCACVNQRMGCQKLVPPPIGSQQSQRCRQPVKSLWGALESRVPPTVEKLPQRPSEGKLGLGRFQSHR